MRKTNLFIYLFFLTQNFFRRFASEFGIGVVEWIFPGNRTKKSAAKKEGRKEEGNRKWMALSLSLGARCFLISEGGRQPK
jgi:hypothetical protein